MFQVLPKLSIARVRLQSIPETRRIQGGSREPLILKEAGAPAQTQIVGGHGMWFLAL